MEERIHLFPILEVRIEPINLEGMHHRIEGYLIAYAELHNTSTDNTEMTTVELGPYTNLQELWPDQMYNYAHEDLS